MLTHSFIRSYAMLCMDYQSTIQNVQREFESLAIKSCVEM